MDIINFASRAESLAVPELRPYSLLISYVTFIARVVGITALQTKGNDHSQGTISLGTEGLCEFAKSLSLWSSVP